ncbi:hypothetical protein [Halosegnis longus]|uniref:hypothetical protein n=1 Tax=Halosegnis longus TaxID=2216012 RepID=UPI00096A549D|nr:hypothetical protein [Salella cibi]
MTETLDARYNYADDVDPTAAEFLGSAHDIAYGESGRTATGVKEIYSAEGERLGDIVVWARDLPAGLNDIYRVETDANGEFISVETGDDIADAFYAVR